MTCAGFGEYAFGEDLFGEAVRPNEQAEHIVVNITAVAEVLRFIQVTKRRYRVRISSLSPPDCTLIVKSDLFLKELTLLANNSFQAYKFAVIADLSLSLAAVSG